MNESVTLCREFLSEFFFLGLSVKDVGGAYKERVDYGVYAVSVRGSKQCKIHLGRLINKITTEVGGSGGGHDKACGASIPKNKNI